MADNLEDLLVVLFEKCDTRGSGFIGREELEDVCGTFGICGEDVQVIFEDLDRDGDGRVSFEDFGRRFREFLDLQPRGWTGNEGEIERSRERRKSQLLGLEQQIFSSGTPDASPRKLRRKFSAEESRDVEEILSKTLGDMQRISDENRKLEVLYRREREERELDVQTLEDELANTVAQAAAKAKEEARREAEAVHLTLRDQMIREREQLQAYFQFFQKADVWLQEQRLKETQEVRRKVEETSDENRHLQMTLTETQTELAMLRSQLAGVRVQYEDKSRQLSSERQQSLEHAHHLDCLRRQIQLLHQANKKLLDANEELRSMVGSETSSGRGRSSSDLPQAVNSIWPGHSQEQFEMELELGVGRLQTEEVGECLREMQHLKASSPDRFPLDRFMEDLDSGLCLRDVESDFDSIPELSYRLPDGSQSQDSLTDLEDQRSGAAGSGGDQRSGAARSGGDQRPVPPDRTFKVVLAGNATVGKSSFITRACRGFFPEHISPTLGVDFFTKMVDLDGRNVAIQLWDTAGQERFRSIAKTYFRRADGILLLYDVTNEKSFLDVREWVNDIAEATGRWTPIMLCGNKVDLRDALTIRGRLAISSTQGEKLASEVGAIFLETSAKNGENLTEALQTLTRSMVIQEDVEMQKNVLKLETSSPAKRRCCRS